MISAPCRAELPSAVHTTAGSTPIRCAKRDQCQRYRDWIAQSGPVEQTSVAWACDGNRFDVFVPLRGARFIQGVRNAA